MIKQQRRETTGVTEYSEEDCSAHLKHLSHTVDLTDLGNKVLFCFRSCWAVGVCSCAADIFATDVQAAGTHRHPHVIIYKFCRELDQLF